MRVEFTAPAIPDLEKIAEDSKRIFGNSVAAELENWFRLSAVISPGGEECISSPEVFHVRHRSRRSWKKEESQPD
jgi:hypothetical protein